MNINGFLMLSSENNLTITSTKPGLPQWSGPTITNPPPPSPTPRSITHHLWTPPTTMHQHTTHAQIHAPTHAQPSLPVRKYPIPPHLTYRNRHYTILLLFDLAWSQTRPWQTRLIDETRGGTPICWYLVLVLLLETSLVRPNIKITIIKTPTGVFCFNQNIEKSYIRQWEKMDITFLLFPFPVH